MIESDAIEQSEIDWMLLQRERRRSMCVLLLRVGVQFIKSPIC